MTWGIAVHGGADPFDGVRYDREEAHLAQVLRAGAAQLAAGEAALDVVERATQQLEACGYHAAGRGASANAAGVWELDALIMDGAARRIGAVACLQGFFSPIAVARRVMETTPHALIAGIGAEVFAQTENFPRIADPAAYYTPAPTRRVKVASGETSHGTVGAVARDRFGRLAAAVSTGGLYGKLPGRVGDTPLPGAGAWADERVAVVCTGLGEFFIKSATAADVSARMRYGGQALARAAQGALLDMKLQGGEGGMIAIDAAGNIVAPFTGNGMKRGIANAAGRFEVATFKI